MAFKALSAGLTGYYRLGVRAQPEDLDGRPRNISVKVTRPGLVLGTYRKVMAGVRPDPAPGYSGDPIQGGPTQYFDPQAFVVQQRGFYGTVPRNSLTGPGFAQTDFSVIKNFRLGGNHRLQFRTEQDLQDAGAPLR